MPSMSSGPGEDDGREVDEAVAKKLIIVNDFGEGTRIVDLSDAGGQEDAARRQPEPEVHGLLQWSPHGVDIAPSDRSAVGRAWDVGVEARPVGERVIGSAAVLPPWFRRGVPLLPHRPAVHQHIDVAVAHAEQSQGKLLARCAAFSIAIGDQGRVRRDSAQYPGEILIEALPGQTARPLDVAFPELIPGSRVQEQCGTGEKENLGFSGVQY